MAWPRLASIGLGRNITPLRDLALRQSLVRPQIPPPFRTPPLRQPLQRRFASYQRFSNRDSRRQQRSNRFVYIWNNYRPAVLAGGTACVGIYVYNLESVPITGRRRFNVISSQLEKQLTDSGYQETLSQYRGRILPENHRDSVMVARVLERLLPVVNELTGETTEWRVHVVNDPAQKNAFVLPGGKVFVFSGLLPLCQDEDGLAAVLGHELAHNIAHHVAERMSSYAIVAPLIILASLLLDISGNTLSIVSSLLYNLPNSRTQEREADHIGLLIMAQSCFNPQAARALWERFEKAEKEAPPQFLSTHPSNYNRIQAITQWLPEAEEKYRTSECGMTRQNLRSFSETLGRRSRIPQQTDDDDQYFWTDTSRMCNQHPSTK